MIRQVSGAPGLESNPNASFSTLNHGDKLPQCLKRSKDPSSSLPLVKDGATRCAAPVCRGYEGAVATRAGSAPVGVGPACPTLVGKREGNTFVGDVGG